MDTDLGRVTLHTAQRPAATMVTDQGAATVMDLDQGHVTTDMAPRLAATMVMARDAATVMDTDHGTSTTAHRPALSHRPARTMDTAHRPVTAMETAKDLVTIMDTDQHRVGMNMDHRAVTGAPLERQPIRQTLMRLSRSHYHICPHLLLVNNDQLARALALFIANARHPAIGSNASSPGATAVTSKVRIRLTSSVSSMSL